MNRKAILPFLIAIISIQFTGYSQDGKIDYKTDILTHIGEAEYERLMTLSLDDFDQSGIGFRQHSGDYALVQILIPEYIMVNELPDNYARNLHWHLGQIHAFNENNEAAIAEMKQAYAGGSVTWECYVTGSIAFLERDEPTLVNALKRLQQQDNQMNIGIIENFDKSYVDAYNAGY